MEITILVHRWTGTMVILIMRSPPAAWLVSFNDAPFSISLDRSSWGQAAARLVKIEFCTGDFYNDYDASDFNQDYIGGQESQVKQSEISDDFGKTFLSEYRLTTVWTTEWTMESGRASSDHITSQTPDSRAVLTKSSTTKTTLTTCSIRTCFEYLSIYLFVFLPIFVTCWIRF